MQLQRFNRKWPEYPQREAPLLSLLSCRNGIRNWSLKAHANVRATPCSVDYQVKDRPWHYICFTGSRTVEMTTCYDAHDVNDKGFGEVWKDDPYPQEKDLNFFDCFLTVSCFKSLYGFAFAHRYLSNNQTGHICCKHFEYKKCAKGLNILRTWN